jgi:assimilatory nitrate reductase catalytic subunit
LQGSHPDRLLTPLIRHADGFNKADWPTALDRVTDNIRRIQEQHGRDAFALLSGASLTNEKAYLMGKFARLALRTRHIDYNGRLCMVAAARRMAFGIDRGEPVVGYPQAEVVWISECRRVRPSPPAMSGKLANTAQNNRCRSSHHSDRADLRSISSHQARRDIALFNGILHDDRKRLARSQLYQNTFRVRRWPNT